MATSLSGLGTRRRPRRMPVIPIFSWLFIILALALLILELLRFSQGVDRIAADVRVAGINVGGLTPAEAVNRWERAFADPVVLWYNDSPILLDPAAIGFRTDRDTMLAAAGAATGEEAWGQFLNYLTGQQSARVLNVPLAADYQPNILRQLLTDIAARYDRAPGPAGYDVQTLTFRPGDPGYILDIEASIPLIDAALRSPNNRQVILPVENSDTSRTGLNSLRELIIAYLESQGFDHDGPSSVASVFIVDLETGEEMDILSDVAFSAASTVKVGILIDFYRHLLFAPNDDEAFLMAQSLLCSNNSSSNLIMQVIGGGNPNNLYDGIAHVTNNMQYLGARNSYISAPLYLGGDQVLGSIPAPITAPNSTVRTTADPFNQTTTEDLGTMFNLIYDCAEYGSGLMTAYPEGDFTQNECRQMIELMSGNDLERLLQGGLPPETRISHKNGWLEDMHGDAGIVYPPNGRNYIIAVFLWEDTPSGFFTFERAWPLIEGVSRAAWNYFVPDQPLISPRTDLPQTAQECIHFAPPYGEVNLDDIDSWMTDGTTAPDAASAGG